MAPHVLVGMLDSPFVRRVAVAFELYGLPYEHLSIATVAEEADFARFSPLKRAPTLVLPDGERLCDSHLILQHLDEVVGPERALVPSDSRQRLLCRQVLGVAAGLADKVVSAIYEKSFHPPEGQSQRLMTRIQGQLKDSLAWLEERAPAGACLFGASPSHADIMVAVGLRFALEAQPEMLTLRAAPGVRAWCDRLDALPALKKTYLPVEPPQR